MGMTVVEKILARAAGLPPSKPGDVVEPRVDLAMSHENAALVINQFLEIYKGTGLEPAIWDPSRVAIIFDHRVPAESPKTATQPEEGPRVRRPAHASRKFHDIRGDVGGICHQILPESGYVRPGAVVVGTDSHTTSHGALGAFAFGIGATEMASVWTLGVAVNVEVPATIKVNVTGQIQAVRRTEGPDPPPDRHAHRPGRELQGARIPRRDDPHDVRRPAVSSSATCRWKRERRRASCPRTRRRCATCARKRASRIRSTPVAAGRRCVVRAGDRRSTSSALEPQIACPHTVDNVKPTSTRSPARRSTRSSSDRARTAGWMTSRWRRTIVRGQEGGPGHADARLPGVRADLSSRRSSGATSRTSCAPAPW